MSTSGKAAPLVGGELGVFCGSELGLSPLGWCGTAEEEGEERFVPPYSVENYEKENGGVDRLFKSKENDSRWTNDVSVVLMKSTRVTVIED